jgi:hypothetical protein
VDNNREFGECVWTDQFPAYFNWKLYYSNFDTFVFVLERNAAIFSHSKRAGGKVAAIFLYSKATW